MIRANPLHLPMAETLAPGLTPDSARLTRSPPSTPSPHLFPIDGATQKVGPHKRWGHTLDHQGYLTV